MHLGLRARSALALAFAVLLVLMVAVAVGVLALARIEDRLGRNFARNATQYTKLSLLAPVVRELALAQRFAESEVTHRWLRAESDPALRELFFAEAEGYRHSFFDHSYFVSSAGSHGYWFNDASQPVSAEPRYILSPQSKADGWFFNTLSGSAAFNINVDPSPDLKLVKVWLNVPIRDGASVLGVAGTGFELTGFIERLTASAEAGVTPMLLARDGSLQAHPDKRLIAYSSVNDTAARHSSILDLLDSDQDRDAVRRALESAAADGEATALLPVHLQHREQLLGLAYMPQLDSFVAVGVDPKAARFTDRSLWLPLALTGAVLLGLLTLAVVIVVERLLLRPLLRLTDSARTMSRGQYSLQLPPAGTDELGELTRAFAAMAERVRTHTDELETRVQERTRELSEVNRQMAVANRKLDDSLQYAGLIQHAILPQRELAQRMADRHFVLWRPRDAVGGDFYIFHADGRGCLIGVIDCAGHGVPGALMTMAAHSALDIGIELLGLADPAALLAQVDERIRAMLQGSAEGHALATHMDAGLVYVDLEQRQLKFAGARTSLYWCDGERVGEIKGDKRAVGDKRDSPFSIHAAPLNGGVSFYLTTDGLLDQAGGDKGLSFGNSRFMALLLRQAHRPMAEQREAFAQELAAYQGELPQRDDITLLGFRFS